MVEVLKLNRGTFTKAVLNRITRAHSFVNADRLLDQIVVIDYKVGRPARPVGYKVRLGYLYIIAVKVIYSQNSAGRQCRRNLKPCFRAT